MSCQPCAVPSRTAQKARGIHETERVFSDRARSSSITAHQHRPTCALSGLAWWMLARTTNDAMLRRGYMLLLHDQSTKAAC